MKKEDVTEELPLFVIQQQYGKSEAGKPLDFLSTFHLSFQGLREENHSESGAKHRLCAAKIQGQKGIDNPQVPRTHYV